MKKIVTLILAIGIPALYIAQGFYGRNNWKNRRHEFAIGGGISGTLTDLGGGKGVGKQMTPFDWDYQATSFSTTFEYSYAIGRRWTTRTNLIYGRVSGDDKNSKSYRNMRGIHFKSDVTEVSQIFIYHFRKERIGHLYSLRNTRGKKLGVTPLNMGWYVFGGIGGFHFNPKSTVRNPAMASQYGLETSDEWIALQPLRTEGQGIPGYKESPYSLFSANIPVGIGMRHSINGDIGVKLELGYRFTFTDYLDDTKKFYADPNDLINYHGGEKGNLAAYFSQPEWFDVPGGIRGRHGLFHDDGYMFLMLTVYFNRDPRHWFDDARRGATKVRKPRASF